MTLAPLAQHILIATFVTVIPASALVAARFWARVKGNAGLRGDDWFILAALLSAWIMTALRVYATVHTGLGYHVNQLPHQKVVDYQKTFLAIQQTYFTTAVLTKVSILLLYRRIFGLSRRFRQIIYFLLFLVACYWIICVLTSILGCRPISYFWNKDQTGWCLNETQFFRWNGVANVILDSIVLLLPLPMVWRLMLSTKQKVALSAIFLIGGFAVLASAFRIVQFSKSRQSDPTYTTGFSVMWSAIEQNVGIFCTCLPPLRPLLKHGPFSAWFVKDAGPNLQRSATDPRSNEMRFRSRSTRITNYLSRRSNDEPDVETASQRSFIHSKADRMSVTWLEGGSEQDHSEKSDSREDLSQRRASSAQWSSDGHLYHLTYPEPTARIDSHE